MLVNDFCAKYGVDRNAVYTRFNPKTTKYVGSVRVVGTTWYMNEDYFLRRRAFKNFIVNQTQKFYYMLDKYFTDVEKSKILASITNRSYFVWYQYFRNQLFRLDDLNITAGIKVNEIDWEFHKIARSLFRTIFKMCGLKPSTKEILAFGDKIWDM